MHARIPFLDLNSRHEAVRAEIDRAVAHLIVADAAKDSVGVGQLT